MKKLLFVIGLTISIGFLIALLKSDSKKNLSVHALSGCLNSPSGYNTRYCYVNDGFYTCENFWMMNCVSAINKPELPGI